MLFERTNTMNPIPTIRLSALLLVSAWVASAIPQPHPEGDDDKTQAPRFEVGGDEGNADHFPLKATDVRASISGVIAEVLVEETMTFALLSASQAAAAGPGCPVNPLDGGVPAPETDAEGAGPRIVFTPSADDWIHQRARRAIGPVPLVVTADRKLARRCRRVGARIMSPGDFIAACPLDPPGA